MFVENSASNNSNPVRGGMFIESNASDNFNPVGVACL